MPQLKQWCSIGCAALLAIILSCPIGYATQFHSGDVISLDPGEILDDVFATGGDISVEADILGDLIIFGRTISLGDSGSVENSMMAAGQTIDVLGHIRNSARLAGQNLTVRGRVERNLMAAGEKIIVAPGASIEKDATLMAGETIIHGHIMGELNGEAGVLTISGQIDGDVDIEADKIVIQPKAIIGGRLKYRSSQDATIEEGARILGGVERVDPDASDSGAYTFGDFVWDAWWFFSTFIVGVILLLTFRNFMAATVVCLSENPAKSIGLGLLFLVGLPVVTIGLLVSLVGIPAGILITIGWLILAYMSKIFVGLAIGDMIFGRARTSRTGGMILAMLVGMAIITILLQVPVLDWVARFVVLASGFGCFILTAYKFHTSQSTPQA